MKPDKENTTTKAFNKEQIMFLYEHLNQKVETDPSAQSREQGKIERLMLFILIHFGLNPNRLAFLK